VLPGEGAAGLCERGEAWKERRLAHRVSLAAQDFLAGNCAKQLCVELRAYRRLQHVVDMLRHQPAVAAQWQPLREFVKEMHRGDVHIVGDSAADNMRSSSVDLSASVRSNGQRTQAAVV
jgi:hypothetical protein